MDKKEDAFNTLMEQVLSFIERFKFIDKAVETLCKKLGKTAMRSDEFNEMLKLYNVTGQMYTKSLELLDSIICRFPQELNPDELEMLSLYRNLSESEKYLLKTRIKVEKGNTNGILRK